MFAAVMTAVTSLGTAVASRLIFFFFFLNDPPTPEIYPFPLPDALPILFGDVIGNHTSDDGEVAADVEIARTIPHRHENVAARAGYAGIHPDPVGIAEGRVYAHGIQIGRAHV